MNFRANSGLLRSAGLAVMLAPLLAACGDDPAAELAEGEREASEEVLEGTISDDMLPIDRVRSQAPLAEPELEEGADARENTGENAGENAGRDASVESAESAESE